MKTKYISVMALLAAFAAAPLLAATSDTTLTVVITVNDALQYSVKRIEVHPGQKLHIVLQNQSSMPKEVMGHNWILLKTGSDPIAYATAAITAKSEDYEPKALADKVIAEIPLTGAKETKDVTFNAPTTPGRYPFLCSFPAHCLSGMLGELIVK